MITWLLKILTRGHSENTGPKVDWPGFLAKCKEHPIAGQYDPGTAEFWRAVQEDKELHKLYVEMAYYYEG